MKMIVATLALLITTTVHGAQIRCENYDLATAQILGETQTTTTLADIKNQGLQLIAQDDLVTSRFYFSVSEESQALNLKIHSQVSNMTTSSEYIYSEIQLKKPLQLGANWIELPGLGDSIHARCFWKP